jgi:hypothetical protein
MRKRRVFLLAWNLLYSMINASWLREAGRAEWDFELAQADGSQPLSPKDEDF